MRYEIRNNVTQARFGYMYLQGTIRVWDRVWQGAEKVQYGRETTWEIITVITKCK